ncbi:3H domain-containing protein [Methanothermobacter wolfeii]|uniref:3H domain-containing protein n=1 Tax=Methanothermobacter wolfeii TaxID=145261 RepID=UPI004046ADAB
MGVSSREEVERFLRSLEEDRNRKASLTRIYESVSGIHSHWISGPDRESLNRALDELKREGILRV